MRIVSQSAFVSKLLRLISFGVDKIRFYHLFFQRKAWGSNGIVNVFLNDQCCDRGGEGRAVPCILYYYGYGDLRVVFRREGNEKRIVFSIRVLCGTGFSANRKPRYLCAAG